MVWRPEDENQSTWQPPSREQIAELERTHVEPRLEIVPTTPTRKINEIGRRPPSPAPVRRERTPTSPTNIVYH